MNTAPLEEPVVTPIDAETAKATKPIREKRPVLWRLFGISVWGVFKLLVVCIIVGFFLLALEFDPAAKDVNVLAALSALVKNLIGAFFWAIQNFWKPLLAGASIVLPLWILWRLVSS